MIRKLLASMVLVAGCALAGQVSIGFRIGPPPAPRVIRNIPRSPGPEYVWVAGYWYPNGKKYKWHDGYWTRPPYAGAHWVAAHHDGQEFFEGYWEGDHGRMDHDHKWDRDRRNRDYGRDHR